MFICDQLPNSKMRISPRPQHQTVAVAVASKLAVSRASQGSPAQPSPAQPSLPVIQLVESRVAAASGTGHSERTRSTRLGQFRHYVDIDIR